MQEDWLKDIHRKMSCYETDEPRDLWEGICRARQQAEQPQPAGGARAAVWLWTRRVAAVAAAVALVFSAGRLTWGDKEQPPVARTAADVEITAAQEREQPGSLPGVPDGKRPEAAERIPAGMPAEKRLAEAAPLVRTPAEAAAGTQSVAEKSLPETEADASDRVRQARQYGPQRRDRRSGKAATDNYIAQANAGRNSSGRLSCGMFMTGGAGSAFNRKSAGGVSAVGIGPDNAGWKDSPLLGILLYNEGKETETDIKHRLPVRAGISFAYRINRRLSLGSGVTYSNLTSDMREGSDNNYFASEQTLHYVGVPLNVSYSVVSWKGLELYASSGLLAEKCVSGKLKKAYILNGQVGRKETQRLSEKPFQWSVNASAGLQYNITPSVGLYAEPGVSYYFKDGTTLKTIYKDKPFNFSFNLGLRFTFKS